MGMHLGRLRRALTLAKSGAGLQEAAKAAGVFWKQEREFLRQARAWNLDELDRIQPEMLDADRACKTAGSPDHLIAERLALAVAGAGAAAGVCSNAGALAAPASKARILAPISSNDCRHSGACRCRPRV